MTNEAGRGQFTPRNLYILMMFLSYAKVRFDIIFDFVILKPD